MTEEAINPIIIFKHYMYRRVSVTLRCGTTLQGHIVAPRLPVNNELCWHFVPIKHVEKYVKRWNRNWLDILPHFLINQVELLGDDDEKANALFMRAIEVDETYY